MKIIFLTSAHFSNDDRIYFLQAKSLSILHRVKVFSTFGGECRSEENLIIEYQAKSFKSRNEKIEAFRNQCIEFNPDVIICSEPLPIIGAYRYKNQKSQCKIIYDVTEFYPSKKNVVQFSFIKKIFALAGMILLNRKASGLVDAFIFGEHYKSLYYRSNFKNKPFIYLPYFQDLSYYPDFTLPKNIHTFSYTGKFSEEKGIIRFASFLKVFKEKNPNTYFNVKLVGWFESNIVSEQFYKLTEGIEIHHQENLPFERYCHSLSETTIFFDLRDIDAENNLCLPIKIFTYASVGRPMIYSSIHAIQHQYPNEEFIKFCKNDDYETICESVLEKISSRDKYIALCEQSRKFSENHQWETIKDEFIRFVTK